VSWPARLREKAALLQRETLALYYAMRDPRTPWTAKVLAGVVVGYAVSPIDLIPDFIPVLGFLDDLVLLPIGIALCIRLVPADVLADARARAKESTEKPRNYVAAAIIVAIWVVVLAVIAMWAKGIVAPA
jgi:uncharacterized membrane protein YkvA (DUF1232 family)